MANRPLARCARVGADHVLLKPGAKVENCAGCDHAIWVSPTTLALPNVTLMCDECATTATALLILAGHMPEFKIAPGALRDPTPDDRRRRNELEAHGFRDITPEELEQQ